jgi:hypothetical protein
MVGVGMRMRVGLVLATLLGQDYAFGSESTLLPEASQKVPSPGLPAGAAANSPQERSQADDPGHGPSAVVLTVNCRRFSVGEADELSARARLALGATSQPGPAEIEFGCDLDRAWIRWVGPPLEELPIDERWGVLEGALEALEQRVRQLSATDPRPALTRPEPKAPTGSEGVALPRVERRSRPPMAAPWSAGGVGLGIALDPVPWAIGPELAVGIGGLGWAGTLEQGVRALLHHPAIVYALSIGLGYGAPWARGHAWGAAAFAGVESLAYTGKESSENLRRTAVSATFGGAIRSALAVGRWRLWTGLMAGWRARPLELAKPYDISLPRMRAVLVVGGLWPAE